MSLDNLEEKDQATQKLNELQALFAPILSILSEDQRNALAKIDKNFLLGREENEIQQEDSKKNAENEPINNLLRMELKHVERNENPWFDDDICY